MKQGRFDDDIRKKLEDYQEDYDPSSWEQMSSLLDNTNFSPAEEDLTPLVKEKLTDYKEDYKPEHWQLLHEELDYIESRRRRLYVLKLAEAAILLLLVFTYWNYQRYQGSYDVHVNQDYVNTVSGVATFPSQVHEKTTPNKTIVLSQEGSQTYMAQLSKVPLIQKRIVAAQPVPVAKAISTNEHVNSLFAEIEPLDRLATSELSVKTIPPGIESEDSGVEEVVLMQPYKRDGWWIGLPVSYDFNAINAGFNFDYLTSHVNQGVIGQTVGLTASYIFKNLEFETGFRYSDKTYAPGLLSNFTKSSKNSFLESQLNASHIRQIQIPVIVKVHAFNPSRSNLYALAGIGFNAILDLDYTIRKSIQPSARVLTQDVSEAIIDLRKLPEGFAEGGSFNDNMYATAIIGIGFQTILSRDISFYFQPQYQYHFSSDLNVLIKKVHTLNIESGLRFKF